MTGTVELWIFFHSIPVKFTALQPTFPYLISYFSYIDKSRMISVKFGSGADDLKGLINAKGRKHAEGEKLPPGEPNLEMYLKLAENFMKKGHFESALYWIGEAADFNSESAVSYYYLSDNE